MRRDLTAQQYHELEPVDGIPYASASRLVELHTRTPMHAIHSIHSSDKPTPAMARGTALHAAVLEPDQFADQYAAGPDVDLRTKSGKAEWDEFCEQHSGQTVLRAKVAEQVAGMREAIWGHPVASELLTGANREISHTWERGDLPCKARLDAVKHRLVIDVKTTQDAGPDGFSRAIAKLRMDMRSAWYLEAMRQSGQPAEGFTWIAIEAAPPHAVAVYDADDELLGFGRRSIELAWDDWRAAVTTGNWVGYVPRSVINLPDWMLYDDEIDMPEME